jgi:DNA-binding response OmpR family regulator
MKTILCIDDDAWMLETFKEALAPRGYRVLVTTSTNAGPGCVKVERVDLVLLDVNMPNKNGLAVYRELQQIEPVPVLFVSGSKTFDPHSEAFRREFDQEFPNRTTDVLHKPFTIAALYDKVEAMIGAGAWTLFRRRSAA